MVAQNKNIVELSGNLQLLASPKFSSRVKDAVQKNDKESLSKLCREAQIPSGSIATVIKTLFSMSVNPLQKYPEIV